MPEWLPEDEWATIRPFVEALTKKESTEPCPYCRLWPCDCPEKEEVYAD